MNELRTFLDRIDAYERAHADILAALDALAAEREAIIHQGKQLGFFAGKLQAALPKVPRLRTAEDAVETEDPDLLDGVTAPQPDAASEPQPVPLNGRDAFRKGICSERCPYPVGSEERKAWMADWMVAQDETADPASLPERAA